MNLQTPKPPFKNMWLPYKLSIEDLDVHIDSDVLFHSQILNFVI